jgi:urease accessory protein
VLVHPPSGLVGGDTLDMRPRWVPARMGWSPHRAPAAFTARTAKWPCSARRSPWHAGARLEWLPLEALCYSGCVAENHLTLNLAPGAELHGLGCDRAGPAACQLPFERGSFVQHIELPGTWLERGRIDAADTRLLNGPLGLAGQRCMATLFFVAGGRWTAPGAMKPWRWPAP